MTAATAHRSLSSKFKYAEAQPCDAWEGGAGAADPSPLAGEGGAKRQMRGDGMGERAFEGREGTDNIHRNPHAGEGSKRRSQSMSARKREGFCIARSTFRRCAEKSIVWRQKSVAEL
jgi:hypothetical protein